MNINTNVPTINTINKQFCDFTQRTVKNNNVKTDFVISQLQKYERQYKRLNFIEGFVAQAQNLAENCCQNNKVNLTGIIYAWLIKINGLPFELKENLIKRAIEVAKKQQDPIHELARTVDLKQLYYKSNQVPQKEYIKTLFSEENLLKNLVRNYEEYSENFKTVSRAASKKDIYKFQLGLSLVNIAKIFLKSDKKMALKKLKEAQKIFIDLNKEKETFWTQGLIKQLKQ